MERFNCCKLCLIFFGGRGNGCILMSLSSSTVTQGRIPLNDFYNSSMYRHWRFTESPEYLRHLAFMQPWLDVVQSILMPCTCCIAMDLIQNDSDEFVTSEYWRRISSCKVLGISVSIRVISRTHHCRGLKAMKFSTGKRKRDITSLQTCVYRLSFLIFVWLISMSV